MCHDARVRSEAQVQARIGCKNHLQTHTFITMSVLLSDSEPGYDLENQLLDDSHSATLPFLFSATPPLVMIPIGASSATAEERVRQATAENVEPRVPYDSSLIPSTVSCLASPNPCSGLPCGPQRARNLLGDEAPHMEYDPLLFADDFTEYIESRMMNFRPLMSQNNVETSLNMHHPYQSETPEQSRSMFKFLRQGNRKPEPHYNTRQNVSSDSFLPQALTLNLPGAHLENMSYTPQARPIEEVFAHPVRSCLCLW